MYAPSINCFPVHLHTNDAQIFDFVNVQFIHNATFFHSIPPSFPGQAYAFANFHEGGVFSDSALGDIGNGASLDPSVRLRSH